MSVELISELKLLKLNGMASCYPELVAKSRHTAFEPDTFMRQLIEAETAERTDGRGTFPDAPRLGRV
jgi:hypothetical protein